MPPPEQDRPPAPASAAGTDSSAAGQTADSALTRWLWRGYLRRWSGPTLLALVLMALEGSMLGVFSFMIQPMFDEIFVAGRQDLVAWVAAGVGAAFVIRAIASLSHRTISAHVGESVIAAIQLDLTRHLMRLDHGFYHAHAPGTLIERVRGDITPVGTLFTVILPAFGRDLVSIVALLGVAFYTDWRWTLVALIGIPLLILPIRALQRLVRRVGARARAESASASGRLDEIFHGIYTIQRMGLEPREGDRLAGALRGFRRAQVRAAAGSAGMSSLSDTVAALGFALVLVYGANQIIAGERTVGEFMSFFTAFVLLFDPLRRMSALSGSWQTVLAGLARVHALFAIAPRIAQPAPPLVPLPQVMRIAFEGVTFAYGTEPVLEDLSLVAEAGQTTALVGPSGAGKSTVFTLLTRLADPHSGRVTIGGADIRRMDLAGLRGLFSVVAQDTALFDETLQENITLGLDVPRARLMAAIEAAHVDAFLPGLPEGLETRVGPRGSGLSGGQRQRVAIARAILRDSPILLLDEATSALDAQSEALVQDALDRLSAQRTTLVIAHRLATVRRADRIVVMDRGRVVEQGSHGALLAADGTYARLHALQFGDAAATALPGTDTTAGRD